MRDPAMDELAFASLGNHDSIQDLSLRQPSEGPPEDVDSLPSFRR